VQADRLVQFLVQRANVPQKLIPRLVVAFRHARYPDGYPSSRNEDTLAKRLMSENGATGKA
jgi:hypothetical protein